MGRRSLISMAASLIRKLARALRSLKSSKVPYVAAGFFIVVVVNSLVFWLIEGSVQGLSFFDAVYWAFITMATIGYGDVVPRSWAGRAIAVETAVTGIIVFTAFVSILAEHYASLSFRRLMGLQSVSYSNHYVLIGRGGILEAAVRELIVNMEKGIAPRRKVVVIVPSPEEKAELSLPEHVEVLVGDPLAQEVLRRACVEEAETVVVATGDDSTTALIVLAVRREASRSGTKIVAEARRRESIPLIKEAGASYVVSTSCFSGRLLASASFEAPVAAFLDDVSTAAQGKDLAVIPGSRFRGRAFREVVEELLDRYGVMPIAIVYGESLVYPPRLDEEVREGAELIALGDVEALEKLKRLR